MVIAVVAAFVVLALAVAVPVTVQQLRGDAQPAVAANLDEVRAYEDLRRDHTEDDVDYEQVPPVGGMHDPVWLDCGAYDAPVRDENAVHDLEHGSIWITYQPDLGADDVADPDRRAARERHPLAVRRPAGARGGDRLGPPAPADRRRRPAAAAVRRASTATGTPRPSRSPPARAGSARRTAGRAGARTV